MRSPRARRTTARSAAAVLLVAALAAAALGCGGEDEESEAEALGQSKAGSVASLVQCSDWTEGTEEEQQATIDDIRGQLHPANVDIDVPPLSDEEAFELFDSACANDFADSFRLYVLYARAVAFAPLTRE